MPLIIFSIFILSLFFGVPAHATALEKIDAMFEKAKNLEDLKSIEGKILDALKDSPKTAGHYWRMARVHYGVGNFLKEQAAKEAFSRCIEHADTAVKLDPGSGPAFFYRGLCKGKKGEMDGLLKSLEIVDPFKEDMETARRLDPAFDHGGPSRALAKLYLELPFFLGGSLSKSLRYIKEAIKHGGSFEENHLYLAEVYYAQNKFPLAREALNKVQELAKGRKQDASVKKIMRKSQELREKIQDRMDSQDPYAQRIEDQ